MSQNFFSAFSSEELQTALSNKLFCTMLDAVPVAIAILEPSRNSHGKISEFVYTFANMSAQRIANGSLAGKKLLPNDDELLFKNMATVADSEKPEDFVCHYPNDSEKWMHYSIKRYDGGVLLTYEDITAQKKAALSLQSEKSKDLSEKDEIQQLNKSLKEKNRELRSVNNELKTFTSIAAYDYKDTLQTMYTNLEFIISRDAQNLSNTGKANLRKAQTAIQKMKLLTDDIVAFSRIQTLDSSPSLVNLSEILANVLKEHQEKIEQTDALLEIDHLPEIHGYPFLLSLLFFHLIDNAIKFRSPEKRLHILVKYDLIDKPGGDMHRISVIDNGIGFSQEEADKVFLMFYRLHDKTYKGSGIGLAICRKITELHGGTIATESDPEKGTMICCFFPV